MALLKCPDCGSQMATTAEKCPHCGSTELQSKRAASGCLGCGVGIIVLILVVMFILGTTHACE